MMSNGLIVFLIVLTLDLIGLGVDGLLYLLGQDTITILVRNKYPEIGTAIILLQLLGVFGLWNHFDLSFWSK